MPLSSDCYDGSQPPVCFVTLSWQYRVIKVDNKFTVNTAVTLRTASRFFKLINVESAAVGYLNRIWQITAAWAPMHTRSPRYLLVSNRRMITVTDPASHVCVATFLRNAIGSHHCPSSPHEAIPLIIHNVISVTIRSAFIMAPVSVGFVKYVVCWWTWLSAFWRWTWILKTY